MQKTGWCHREKAVLVTVYTIKPTRTKASSNINHHHHHHHHHYHHVYHSPTPRSSVGYNRKAELLRYAQHLRALAHGATMAPGHRITYSNTPEKKSNKLVPVSRKHKYRRTPTCFGDWKKILLPSIVPRSLASFQEKKKRRKKGSESTSSKMSTIVKSLTALKQGLVKKLLSAFPKQK
ncbi:uncharacterized protein [Elaeis guineensis]|uniref:Probable pectinesterase 15 n=1 Tax=Elaeis guineensis var. tenera TaxID=51953 RepID=A0A6J0PS58_ELAGV|nr:probable pectinesterase 15 [Elaeis guineensis]